MPVAAVGHIQLQYRAEQLPAARHGPWGVGGQAEVASPGHTREWVAIWLFRGAGVCSDSSNTNNK